MDEQGCPRCKTTKYRNPSLKLMVNACGHSLCESCVELLFVKGSGACPECGTPLRKSNFRLQIFEDAVVEKEIDIRKRVLRDFNKKEEDFPGLKEYNDYLETIETIVFNLSNQIDVDATKKMIDQYKKDNKDQIRKSQSKMSRDEEFLDTLIEEEQHNAAVRKMMDQEEVKREKAAKKKIQQSLIDDLMFSDMSAKDIISSHRQNIQQQQEEEQEARAATTAFSTGIKIGQHSDNIHLMKQEQGQVFHYCPLIMEWCGPEPPTMDEIYHDGYLRNIRAATDQERAGGFREATACHRALQDALCGLFSFPNINPSPVKSGGAAASSTASSSSSSHLPMVLS
ncbi:CDK-activating kinase assembly factor MAT1 [Aplysia californica]|uniref:CDK-activating kinase assembly factor MAT1 n=1 Tax=Aplysia californica TaxID=6500 RepID=A0ABM0JQM2_APLCA|nr:CDK-activating kinase assembly factor MAT1 [Aplysia californica]